MSSMSPIPSLKRETDLFTSRSPAEIEALKYDRPYDRTRPWERYAMGYPRFAAFIANDEDKSTTIYRRFERLSARNILYLESELTELEAKQDELDEESRRDEDLASSAQSWEELHSQANYNKTEDFSVDSSIEERARKGRLATAAQDRLELARRIRSTLKEYHKALKLESDILTLSVPNKRTLKGVRRVFKNYDRQGKYRSEMIAGKMETHLDEENKGDLCVLAAPAEQDRLTRLLEGRFAFIFRTKTAEGVTGFVSHRRVAIAVSAFSTISAAAFLIGAIIGLYYVTSPTAKLGMLSGLTVAFAGSLGLLTNARRQDVFAATAAYEFL
ncbi:hypothetical protein MMC12_008640 [Toensbergia leucococca]|nr:hypothetical protein [Toensbergia leucococca]